MEEEEEERKSWELGELDGPRWGNRPMEYIKWGGWKNWLKNHGEKRVTLLFLPARSIKVSLRVQSVIIALPQKRVEAARPSRITKKS